MELGANAIVNSIDMVGMGSAKVFVKSSDTYSRRIERPADRPEPVVAKQRADFPEHSNPPVAHPPAPAQVMQDHAVVRENHQGQPLAPPHEVEIPCGHAEDPQEADEAGIVAAAD